MSATAWISKAAALLATLSASPLLAEAPKRVVSVNLCTDQMAMQLAAPDQLISISFLALDPQVSAMSQEAQNYPINHGGLEEIVSLEPDLVLAHEWTSPLLIASLQNFKIPTQIFSTPQTAAQIPDFVRAMGQALGQEPTAQSIIQDFNTELQNQLKALDQIPQGQTLINYGAGGWIGSANTLTTDLINLAKFENLARSEKYNYGGFMPLETLITSSPDVVLIDGVYPASSRAESLLAHPAILKSAPNLHHLQSSTAWGCGLPQSLQGLSELIELQRKLQKGG